MKVKVTYGTIVVHTAYNECSNQYVVTMKMKVIAMATSLALVLTLGVLTTLHTQLAFAAPLIRSPLTLKIQSGGNSNSGGYYQVTTIKPHHPPPPPLPTSYHLTVNVPSKLHVTVPTVGISITPANGHIQKANVPTAGGSHTFTIPKSRVNRVQVCVNSGTFSKNISAFLIRFLCL